MKNPLSRYPVILLPVVLSACLTNGTGSVQSIGKDSYTIRTLSKDSTSAAKQEALKAANAHCGKNQRNIQMVKEFDGTEMNGQRFYDMTFYCLPMGDEDFVRYRPTQPAAN